MKQRRGGLVERVRAAAVVLAGKPDPRIAMYQDVIVSHVTREARLRRIIRRLRRDLAEAQGLEEVKGYVYDRDGTEVVVDSYLRRKPDRHESDHH